MVMMVDVARAVGVSVATVSNYINHTKSVSANCAARIADAIESLRYVPNQMTKTLKTSMSNNVGLFSPTSRTPTTYRYFKCRAPYCRHAPLQL